MNLSAESEYRGILCAVWVVTIFSVCRVLRLSLTSDGLAACSLVCYRVISSFCSDKFAQFSSGCPVRGAVMCKEAEVAD